MPLIGQVVEAEASRQKPSDQCSRCKVRFRWCKGGILCWWCFHQVKDGNDERHLNQKSRTGGHARGCGVALTK